MARHGKHKDTPESVTPRRKANYSVSAGDAFLSDTYDTGSYHRIEAAPVSPEPVPPKKKRKWLWPLLLAVLLAAAGITAAVLLRSAGTQSTPVRKNVSVSMTDLNGDSCMRVTFLDVGEADCALIQCGGEAMLIDSGNYADLSYVKQTLQSLGVTTLKYIIATHPHEDHIGCMGGLIRAFGVETLYAPSAEYHSDSTCFDVMNEALAELGKSITVPRANETIRLDSAELTFLSAGKTYENTNDTSLVARLRYGETVFLFTGDIEWDAEHDLVEAGIDLSADVLKVPHHGSASSSSYVFLYQVMPRYAVISVGRDNEYGHPDSDVLSRLRDADAAVLRTDELGTITCFSDGTALVWSFSGSDLSE